MTARNADPYAALEVIDRLEVGPVRLERRRLVAPYTVVKGRRRERTTLVYRYEEDVFDPGAPGDRNLAALVALQVALNYGLFCREIVLHGPLDRNDRRFVEVMAENTAREILVKKILQPNVFLRPPATGLPALRRESYLRARLVFPGAVEDGGAAADAGWHRLGARRGAGSPAHGPASRGHAVLSSGGKDSLLSFGLLEEIGRPAHAVYVNESGRHWYTALNAHRHFADRWPGRTSRVWTNSDRLFAWMARRLPFVRPDFQSVRSDEYPIRLWTVAVFLFGALPVLRARGLSRLLIGDEFDTSRRAAHAGIPHYDGVYDQSRWFDNALSRFYNRKGWGLCQFSVLRPLSELLVQSLLAGRYPELLRHQVSCHAAHIERGRVRPCGDCEKCRRIVGMLVATGHDPRACGYSPAQVKACLAALARRGVAQEALCAEQTLWMLREQGLVRAAAGDRTAIRERPEALALRFDPELSPAEDVPADLRAPLYRIAMRAAKGALARAGRVWIPIDPLREDFMQRPYRYEARETRNGRAAGAGGSRRAGTAKGVAKAGRRTAKAAPAAPAARAAPAAPAAPAGPRPWILGELTWPEAERRFAEVDIALLPVGSTEQHGPHLPLDVDSFDAEHLAGAVAERCAEPRPLVLPLIPYGVAYHHEDFAGTLSVSPETLSRMVHEVGLSAARHGITKLLVVNGHGGNRPALHFAAQMINRDAHIFTCVDTGESSDADVEALVETENDVHAGEIETSTTLALRPHLVPMEKARRAVPSFASRYLDFGSARAVEWYARTSRLSRSGVLGDPTRATAEKGRAIWEAMTANLVELVEALKGLSLDQIHQRRS